MELLNLTGWREVRWVLWRIRRGCVHAAFWCCLVVVLNSGIAASAQSKEQGKQDSGTALDRQFQDAVALYDAGKFKEAEGELERLLPRIPENFQVQELIGLVYAAQSKDLKAEEHFEAAVRLDPRSAAARTNLAACLSHLGKQKLAGEQFRKAIELAPDDYEANHNLGEFYVGQGKIADARPLLEEAQRIAPSYENGHDLAEADLLTGRYDEAREVVRSVMRIRDTGELHNLLGHVEEKDGKFVAAAKELETAAHMDPSEDNLFDWGSEFLLHSNYSLALDIFAYAVKRYPQSPRIQMGIGIALLSLGKYEEAVKALLVAIDLNPADASCYRFLAHAYKLSPAKDPEVVQRFEGYARVKPADAMAQYEYAESLGKGDWVNGEGFNDLQVQRVQSLLQKSIALDGNFAEAHLQLGVLYSAQHDYERSIPEYVRASELNADIPEVHYHLAQDYSRVGKKELAKSELEAYRRLRAQHLAALDSAVVQEFVLAETSGGTARPPAP